MFLPDKARQGGEVGGVVEEEQGSFDRCSGVELCQGKATRPPSKGYAAKDERARGIAKEHHALTVPAIHEGARREAEKHIRGSA